MTMTPGGGARAGGPDHAAYGPGPGDAHADPAYPDPSFPGTGYAHAVPAHDAYATDAARPVWPALLHGAGALASLALVVGIGVWGYGQVKRDVSGVPVVRALEGPMRVAPDQPGGQISDHVGLSVNAVKAGGTAAPVPETLVLAPEEGALAPEDRPAPELAPDAGAAPAPGPAAPAQGEAPAPMPLVEARLEGSVPVAALPTSEDGPVQDGAAADAAAESTGAAAAVEPAQPHAAAIAEALAGAGIAPLSAPRADADTGGTDTAADTAADTGAEAEADAETGAAIEADTAPQVASETAPAAVLRPAPRPATRLDTLERDGSFLRLAAAEDAEDAELPQVPPGTRLVQIGAFDSIAEARAGWAEVQARFGPLMADKDRVLQQAEAGGRTFWRLRAAGFDDLAHARRFCAALVAERADCIPVVAR